jgi:hypothetical protein
MHAYPIVSSDHLDPAASRGLFGLGRKRRETSELPRAGAHQVWVYRVEGRYIVNRGERTPRDEDVVRADLVCLVDVGEGVTVTVDLKIPSADGTEFALRVSFACTVIDPAKVVRDNINAERAILAYLQRDSRLGSLALNYRMDDLTQVRNDVAARIRAYAEVKPPVVPGLMLSFIGLEVPTPREVAEFKAKIRTVGWDKELDNLRRGHRQGDDLDDERHSQELAGRRRRGRHVAEAEDQEHDQILKARQLEQARREVEFAFDSIGGDPLRALIFAQAQGEINAKELAERMVADSQDRVTYARQQHQLDREEDRQEIGWKREDARLERQDEREERIERERYDREQRRLKREEKRVRRGEEREDHKRQLDMKLDVLRELAKNGHLDMVNVRVDKLVADISGAEQVTGPPEAQAMPLESGAGKRDEDAGSDAIDVDVEVREEDD